MSTVAHQLAAAHPEARLPCPICANTLASRNLSAHLAKVHAGDDGTAGGPWRGRRFAIFPASLVHEDGAIVLRTLLGRRTVKLPCTVELGNRIGTQHAAGMSSYVDDYNLPHTTVRIGWYLRLGGAITIGCKTAANVKAHWTGWQPGPRRRVSDIVIERRALVAIEYALAAAGVLRPLESTRS